MTKIFRTDVSKPGAMQRLDNGFVRFPMTVSRAGILVYRLDDGTEWREYRPASEAFSPTSMATLANIPMTNDHPAELLNSENAGKHMVGYTGDTVQRVQNADGEYVGAWATLTDKKAIADMDAGKQEISAGYELDLDQTPGVWNGERYDAIQTEIAYNHVALVNRGRAGPGARVKMDAKGNPEKVYRFDSFLSEDDIKQKKGNHCMDKTLSLGGVDYKVSTEAEAAILKRLRGDSEVIETLKKELEAEKAKASKEAGRADGLVSDLAKAKTDLDEAKKQNLDEAAIQARVDARVALLTTIVPRLPKQDAAGNDIDYSKMSEHDIKVALIVVADKKFDAKSDKAKDTVYVQSRVDHILATTAADDDGEEKEEVEDDEEEESESNSDDSGASKELDRTMRRRATNDAEGKGKPKNEAEKRALQKRKDAEAYSKPIGFTRDQLRR